MLNKKSILYKTLARAVSMKRPHATASTRAFTDWLHNRLPRLPHIAVSYDAVGNLHVDARQDLLSRTLFVAHVDTVHREEGSNRFRKTQGMWYADGACLGADDGAGCALLMHLIHAQVPGYYIFTQGEEKGGIGAKYLADHSRDLLAQFDRAIAFDRRGIDSVITHQGWGRCCSDAFAAGLADALCADEVLMYLGDDTGVYTDTAEFVDIIPECTNISVGYDHEHSDRETLDLHHFKALAAAVVRIKWDELPTVRDPLEVEEVAHTDWLNMYKTHASTLDRVFDSTKWDSKWLDDDDTDAETDTDTLLVMDCIDDARRGMYHDLLEMIAHAAYPEDPEFALRFLNRRLLTDEVLDKAMDDCAVYGADTVLLSLFDAAHCEV
jgi:hypothetical protein